MGNPLALRANLFKAAYGDPGGIFDLYKKAWLGSESGCSGDGCPFLAPLANMLGGKGPIGGLLGNIMSTYLQQLQRIIAQAMGNR